MSGRQPLFIGTLRVIKIKGGCFLWQRRQKIKKNRPLNRYGLG